MMAKAHDKVSVALVQALDFCDLGGFDFKLSEQLQKRWLLK